MTPTSTRQLSKSTLMITDHIQAESALTQALLLLILADLRDGWVSSLLMVLAILLVLCSLFYRVAARS